MSQAATSPLLDAALDYARRGWPVLPLHTWTGTACTCGRACESPAKHPRTRKGLHDATTDERVIASWWGRWPDSNIGLRTGVAFDVLDIDGDAGLDAVEAMERQHHALTDAPSSATGGGGMHRLYLPSGTRNRAGILEHVDWRGDNGYIVAPPSLHPTGRTYTWLPGAGPDFPLRAPDPWLLELVKPTPAARPAGHQPVPGGTTGAYARRAFDAEISGLARAVEGTRNDTLNDAAFSLYQLVAGGELDENEVEGALRQVAAGIGLPAREIEQTLRSARSAGVAAPRTAPQLSVLPGRRPRGDAPQAPRDPPAADARDESERRDPDDPLAEQREVIKIALLALRQRSVLDGAAWLLDTPTDVPAVWGHGDDVLWADGEPLLVVGPTGVGKTTLTQQLALARIGVGEPTFLGMPLTQSRRTLYVVADRPAQAQRSLARMVTAEHRDLLAERLVVWKGPLPYDLAAQPEILVALAEMHDVDTIILDSLKDFAVKLSDDEVGGKVARAFQRTMAEGINLVALHHQRKPPTGNGVKPKGIDEVYGSVHVPNTCGSVVVIWGDPGDPVVELTHLKQPAGVIGPLQIEHDHLAGRSTVVDQADPLTVLRSIPRGITAAGMAVLLYGPEATTRKFTTKAKRKLDWLVSKDLAYRVDGGRNATGQAAGDIYYATDTRSI